MNESANSGEAIPNPKNRKFRMFAKAFVVKATLAKNAAINAGLHGITIAPKNNPNKNALSFGFLTVGVFDLGINLPKFISNINAKLTNPSIVNAIGEIIPITFVKDICKSVVKINPSVSMNKTTPRVTKAPSFGIVPFFDLSLFDNLFERNAKNPG